MARLNPTNFGTQNFYSAVLTGDITSGTLTIGLDTVPTPTSGILVIEPDSTTNREVILYTSKGASTITCPSDGRGFDGSTAVAHLTGTTVIYAPVKRLFDGIASGELSTDPIRLEQFFDFVASGLVWSGDAYASTRNASMTTGVVYILGRRLTVAAVNARSFTASKDTYIDLTDAGDGTATITYTEVTNNAASPALTTNALRIGIIVTGASNIAAAGSVNQGEENKVLPIASSVPYAVTDSLGNLICPRDPNRRTLGYRQILTSFAGTSGSTVDVTGLSVPFIAPGGRKVKVQFFSDSIVSNTNGSGQQLFIRESGTTFAGATYVSPTANYSEHVEVTGRVTPTAGLHTYTASILAAGTTSVVASSTTPAFVLVELI